MLITLNPLKRHKAKWGACFRCPLGARADKRCYYDKTPGRPYVLFIGEGPGESEDALGKPFVGASGALLRDAIKEAGATVPYAFANLVVCRPQDKKKGSNRVPAPAEVAACSQRLLELVRILKPALVVCVGKVPNKHVPQIFEEGELLEKHGIYVEVSSCYHPSYIIRNGGKKSSLWPNYVDFFRTLFEGLK